LPTLILQAAARRISISMLRRIKFLPGDPDIDSNLSKPNAPIPSHAGLTGVSTSGMNAYDTPSGDLESGDYAQESDGISNVPAYTYTDATSSVPIAAHIATSNTDPTAASSQ
jgi:hypothetical protein